MRTKTTTRLLATAISLIVLYGVWQVSSSRFVTRSVALLVGTTTNAPATTAAVVTSKEWYDIRKVVDGDTIDVDIDGAVRRVRLIGINTPETVDPRKPVQCFGKEASDEAKQVLTGKKVRLEADPSQDDTDIYGRLLRYVFLADGTNFDLMMIKEGFAYEYTYHLPYKYQTAFKAAQADAHRAGRGLWAADTCNGILSAVKSGAN